MLWSLRRAAATVALAALTGVAAPTAAAQSDAGIPTLSAAPSQDATETAAPRRRPVPRTARTTARTQPTPRSGARRDSAAVPITTVSSRSSAEAASRTARIDRSLRSDAPNWLGIPYRWGGATRRGIDCSAFVQQFVRQNLGVELPRTTASQQYEGVSIDKDELQAGDLVFFRRRGVRHVGVYLSGGEFIHASSSRGVTVSELESDYWSRYYWMSRRIVSEPSGRLPTPRAAARRDSSGVRG